MKRGLSYLLLIALSLLMGLVPLVVWNLVGPMVYYSYPDDEARKEMRLLDVLVGTYQVDTGIQLQDGADLAQVLEHFPADEVESTRELGVDPWGVPYVFVEKVDGSSFGIFTAGADGVANTEDDIASWSGGRLTNFYSNIRLKKSVIQFFAVWFGLSAVCFFFLRTIRQKRTSRSDRSD